MSYCKSFGKDKVLFMTKDDMSTPSTIVLPPPPPSQGVITEDGKINWNCPCLGGMPTGPCGVEFRTAFSCFHYSESDPKGADCYDAFSTMQQCFQKYPSIYNKDEEVEAEPNALGMGADLTGVEGNGEAVKAAAAAETSSLQKMAN